VTTDGAGVTNDVVGVTTDGAEVTNDVAKFRDSFTLKCHVDLNDFFTLKKEALHFVEH